LDTMPSKPSLQAWREDGGAAVSIEVLAELDSGPRPGEQLPELGLALLEWPRPPVFALELKQVEGVEYACSSWARLWSLSNMAKPASRLNVSDVERTISFA
jgi:hypothetical protein